MLEADPFFLATPCLLSIVTLWEILFHSLAYSLAQLQSAVNAQ